MSKYSTLAALAVLASACGAVSNGGATGDATPTPTPGSAVTIADIQKGNVAENANVTLDGLVVFAVKVGGAGVDFWAQDAGGGVQSGIYFFDQNGNTPADIAVGDEVTVSGIYKEFYELSEITVTEVSITNNGLTPTADAAALSDLSDPANAEVWEGCLIEVTGTDLTVGGAVNNYGEFPLTNGTDSLMVDDFLYDGTEGLSSGAAISYVAGVMHYAFEEWKLLPRAASDLESEILPVVPTTIVDIQTGAVTPEGGVTVENVVVTAVRGTTGFWAQDVGGGANSGLYFFAQNPATFPAGIAVGDEVTVTGTYKEFYDFSEVIISEAAITNNGLAIVVDDVALEALASEEWESCLVNVTSVAAMTVGAAPDEHGQYPVTNGTDTILVDDFIYDSTADFPMSTAVGTLVGILNYSFDEWKMEPRSASDISQ